MDRCVAGKDDLAALEKVEGMQGNTTVRLAHDRLEIYEGRRYRLVGTAHVYESRRGTNSGLEYCAICKKNALGQIVM